MDKEQIEIAKKICEPYIPEMYDSFEVTAAAYAILSSCGLMDLRTLMVKQAYADLDKAYKEYKKNVKKQFSRRKRIRKHGKP